MSKKKLREQLLMFCFRMLLGHGKTLRQLEAENAARDDAINEAFRRIDNLESK